MHTHAFSKPSDDWDPSLVDDGPDPLLTASDDEEEEKKKAAAVSEDDEDDDGLRALDKLAEDLTKQEKSDIAETTNEEE